MKKYTFERGKIYKKEPVSFRHVLKEASQEYITYQQQLKETNEEYSAKIQQLESTIKEIKEFVSEISTVIDNEIMDELKQDPNVLNLVQRAFPDILHPDYDDEDEYEEYEEDDEEYDDE